MGCCHSALGRERQRDAEQGWHDNNAENDEHLAREMSEADPIETKLELEGTGTAPSTRILPAELESPVETTRQPQISAAEVEEPPPYSPGGARQQQQPVVMNREPRISDESSRSIQPGRASEDSGFEKREQVSSAAEPEDPGFDSNKYRGVVM